MTPAILCLKAFDPSNPNREVWSFCRIEGQPVGSMLQETSGWVNNTYHLSVVNAMVWGWTRNYPGAKLTFSVVVPQSTTTPKLAAD